jgi:hypothetical protein
VTIFCETTSDPPIRNEIEIYVTQFQYKFLPISVDPSEHEGDADICDKLAEVPDDGNGE